MCQFITKIITFMLKNGLYKEYIINNQYFIKNWDKETNRST